MPDDALPPPEPPRARRRRTHRRWIGVGAALALAALIAALSMSSDAVRPAPPIAVSPAPAGREPCATAPTGTAASIGARTYASVVPGAVSVRLCNTNELGGGVPPDALTTHLSDLTDLINGLPRLPSDASCTMELGPHYALLFDYPDGGRAVVGGELDGCRVIVGRRGADTVVERFLGWLLDQRLTTPPPVVDVTPTCPATYPASSWLPPALSDTVRAAWCPIDHSAGHPIRRWTAIRDDIAARAAEGTAAGGNDLRGTVSAVSPSGEVTVLWLNGSTLTWSSPTAAGAARPMGAVLTDAEVAGLTGA